ncbi:hypothetical protein [Lentilactobacillus kisonensis]|uniref:Uncharacterized protein n=1 Tax=Lentilactobacillus kisonensis DSM 19906 = JCM 15041 TaxID=1423766 RepID=A0A0R1NRH8_9LACO|nr:hypothetical protein [Lentilactobacillus kisonensis]KRL20042.1 hypothetical protein FC98_GL002032 [Lentilactobacillus kisonensis DSM 19906 = JCM 15041]
MKINSQKTVTKLSIWTLLFITSSFLGGIISVLLYLGDKSNFGSIAEWVGSIGTVVTVASVALQIRTEHDWTDLKQKERVRPVFVVSKQNFIEKSNIIWSCYYSLNQTGMDWTVVQCINENSALDVIVDIKGWVPIVMNGEVNRYQRERRLIPIPGLSSLSVLLDTSGMKVDLLNIFYKSSKNEINKLSIEYQHSCVSFPQYTNSHDCPDLIKEYSDFFILLDQYSQQDNNYIKVGSYKHTADSKFFGTSKFVLTYQKMWEKNNQLMKAYFPH